MYNHLRHMQGINVAGPTKATNTSTFTGNELWDQIKQANQHTYDPYVDPVIKLTERIEKLEIQNKFLKLKILEIEGKFTKEEVANIRAMLISNDEASITLAETIIETT